MMSNIKNINLSACAALIIFIILFFRVLHFYYLPESLLPAVIADDAFYYIQIAKHKVTDNIWSFDGLTPTTGFHFLYAYLLVLIYQLDKNISLTNLFLIIGTLSSIFIALSAYFTCQTATRLTNKKQAWVAGCLFITPIAIIQSTHLMEAWLVLLFSSLTIFHAISDKPITLLRFVGLITIGLLGSLSRTDYGIFPEIIFITFFVFSLFNNKIRYEKPAIILAGAIAGVSLSLIHNFYISGNWLQSSAKIKLWWSSLAGHPIQPIINMMIDTVFPFNKFFDSHVNKGILGIISIMLIYQFYRRSKNQQLITPTLFSCVITGCIISIISYLLFYSRNSQALNVWYCANLIVPAAIASVFLLFSLFHPYKMLPAILTAIAYGYLSSLWITLAPFPHQVGMMHAGNYIKKYGSQFRYGSWNAGTISYFSDAKIINLDGLVNDELFPYMKSNKLFYYLKEKNIDFIVDYEVMLLHDYLKIRGGYADERLYRCLVPGEYLDQDSPNMLNTRLRLFKIKKECL